MNLIVPSEYTKLFQKNNNIVKYPADILRVVTKPVENTEEAQKIVSRMSDILRTTRGIGLAAPQIGVDQRIIMIRHEQRYVLYNPVIEEASGSYVAEEGCLSIPGLWGNVLRHNHITLRGTSPHGKETVLKLSGMAAVVPQHEIDHLDGVLFIDRLMPGSAHWFSPEVGKRLLAEFLDPE
jgi:peptide deformylase